MNVELTPNETKLLLASLEVYRRVKGAEGRLTSQKHKDKASIDAAYAPYQSLLNVLERTRAKLQG